MAIITQGILGGFSGTAGPVVGSTWKGKPVVRARPKFKKNRKFSQVQLDQQEKFALVGKLLHSIGELLKISFHRTVKQLSSTNVAMAYNLREAVVGDASPYMIDYARLRLAKGSLPLAIQPVVEAMGDKTVKFTWTFIPDLARTKPSDKAVAVLYSESANQFLYKKDGVTRSGEELILDAQVYTGQTVHAWFFFMDEDETKACDSLYMGTVDVPA